jgi:hypothetical protein
MRKRQLGVTAVGWLILLTPFVILGYAGVRAAPVYLKYMKIVRALDQAGSELKGGANPQSIRVAIDKHFEIDMVDDLQAKDFKITKDGGAWVVEAAYEDDAPLFSNISLHWAFDKTVKINASGGE